MGCNKVVKTVKLFWSSSLSIGQISHAPATITSVPKQSLGLLRRTLVGDLLSEDDATHPRCLSHRKLSRPDVQDTKVVVMMFRRHEWRSRRTLDGHATDGLSDRKSARPDHRKRALCFGRRSPATDVFQFKVHEGKANGRAANSPRSTEPSE